MLILASVATFAEVSLFAQYLGPGRDNSSNFSDSVLYELLGRTFASTGIFARYVGESGVVAEPLRTFGYPAFLAMVFGVAGPSYSVIWASQAALLATLPPVMFFTARGFLSQRASLLSAWTIPIYAPLSYWAAVGQSDFFSSFLVTIGIAALVWSHQTNSMARAAAAGALLGWATVTRPALIVVGLALGIWLLVRGFGSITSPRRATVAFFAALLVLPGLSTAYTKINFDRFAMVAVGPGLPLWEGYWQGSWSGLANNEFEALADSGASRATIAQRAAELSVPPDRVMTYLAELAEVTRVSQIGPNEPNIIGVENELARQDLAFVFARNDILADPIGYLGRGFTYRAFALWASEIPVRKDQIDRLPRIVVYSIWAPQVLLVPLSLLGVIVSFRRSRLVLLYAIVFVAIWLAHFPFSSQPRYSLPAKPFMLMLSIAALIWLVNRGSALARRPADGP